MPVVAVTGLTFFFGLPNAIAITIIPALVANAIQAFDGKNTKKIIRRITPFLVPAIVTTWAGTIMLTNYTDIAVIALAGVLLVYSISGTFGLVTKIKNKHDKWVAPVCGVMCGIANGMTGVASPPTIIYLNGIELKKNELSQALGICFLVLFIVLAICLWSQKILNQELVMLGIIAIIPTVAGQWAGRKLRTKMSEQMFRYVLYRILILVAAYLIIKTIAL